MLLNRYKNITMPIPNAVRRLVETNSNINVTQIESVPKTVNNDQKMSL
jgi:hypothetical protein